jgi:hypothetical protein
MNISSVAGHALKPREPPNRLHLHTFNYQGKSHSPGFGSLSPGSFFCFDTMYSLSGGLSRC